MRAKVAGASPKITPDSRGNNQSFKLDRPGGFTFQVNGPKYTGHVGP